MTYRLIYILLLFNLLMYGQSNPPDTLIKNAYIKLADRKFNDAINLFTLVINSNPEKINAYTGRALVYNLMFKLDDATKDIYKVLSIDPKFDEAYYVRGLIHINQKKLQLALEDLNYALELNPKYKAAKAAKINLYFLMQDYKKALDLADKEIENDATYGDYYFYKGKILNKKERFNEALENMEKAIEFNVHVDKFEIYLHRGDAKQNLNDLVSAKGDFDKAILLNSNNASAFHGRGVVNYKIGNFEDALSDFNYSIKLMELYPDFYDRNAETYYNLGMTYYKLNQTDKACKNFHLACSMQNDNACKMVILKCNYAKTP